MTPKVRFKVDMTIECRPDLIEHLMEEFALTADFENALVIQYRYYVEKNEQESKRNSG